MHATVGFELRCNISISNSAHSWISVLFGIALKKVYFLEIHCSHVGPDTQMPHLQTVFFIKSIAVHLLCFEFSSLYFMRVSSTTKSEFNRW